MNRATAPELMDAEDLPAAVYADVLADLARVNRWTLARRPTLAWLARVTRGMNRFTLLDVGYGQGDMLRAIAGWAAARGLTAELTGIDRNPNSAAAARAAGPGLPIRYITGDTADHALAPDFIISSLVAHHMTDPELVGFLRWMQATARRGWFINDLHRHWLAHAGFRALAAAGRFHPIVRHDGALSVRRAFVRADWERLLAEAEVEAEVRWHLPFRWGVASR
ncbi:methyltransferase domain-containing protein [Polymorphobacter sp.]|uniref:methyltransferase domain-containing protein n=1 Tax=Polymorphobacter sp. TaxID=1909290 RepID=UPI003F6F9673